MQNLVAETARLSNTEAAENVKVDTSPITNDTFAPGLDRLSIYRGLCNDLPRGSTTLRSFLTHFNIPVEFPEIDIKFANTQERLSLYPNERQISVNFACHNHANKRTVNIQRRTLILGVEHKISTSCIRTYCGKQLFRGTSEIIIEDILTGPKKKGSKVSLELLRSSIHGTAPVISHMPQQNYYLKDIRAIPIKKEFEGVKVELGFDHRALMLTLGACLGQYLSKGAISLDHSQAARKHINVSPSTIVGKGEIIFSSACGSSDLEMNTFCILAGISGASLVILFSERVSICNEILTGISLYDYICRLVRNILYSADLCSCSAEHFWALMCGMHKVLKVYSHTDEGGAFRNFLTSLVVPPPQGVIYEAERDILGVQPNLYENSPLDKRTLLDWLLFFPNAVTFSDTGVQTYKEYIPTILTRHPDSAKSLSSYRGFTVAARAVINNIMQILRKVFSLTHSVYKADYMYLNYSTYESEDRHCNSTTIAPFVWLDPSLSNVYNLSHIYRRETIGYYSIAKLPFVPKETVVAATRPGDLHYLSKNSHLRLTLPQHCLRNYGYGYMLNPRYNTADGLCELIITENEDLASEKYLTGNFLYSSGDPLVGKNKWTTPNCTLSNYHEFLPLQERYTALLYAARADYYPSAEKFLDGTLETEHILSSLQTLETCIGNKRCAKFAPKNIEVAVRESIDIYYTTSEVVVDETPITIAKSGATRGTLKLKEKLTTPIGQVGDNLNKINHTQKSSTSNAQLANDKSALDSAATATRQPDSVQTSEAVDESLDTYTQEISGEQLQQLIETQQILTPVIGTPVQKRECAVGDKTVPKVKINLIAHNSSEADTPNSLVPPGTWDFPSIDQAEETIEDILADSYLRSELDFDFMSFIPPQGLKSVPKDKADDAWIRFITESAHLLTDRGLKPAGLDFLGFCGHDPNNPTLRLWRLLAIGVSGKYPNYRFPIKVVSVSKVGSYPTRVNIEDLKNNDAEYRNAADIQYASRDREE